jgi:aryl-alcohol dehydrogenase-like predicted oxidoreductase
MAGDFRGRRTLGRSGIAVSRLGIAGARGIGVAPLERAFHEHGVNTFYWGSIRTRAMAEAIRNVSRTNRDGLVVILQSYDHAGFWVRRSVERGLRTLGLERADILMLGWCNRYPVRRMVDACLRLKAEGKVRCLALSGHRRAFHGEMAARRDTPFDVLMLRYNAAHRGAEEEVFPRLPAAGRPGIMTYTATRWGFLLNPRKMPPGEAPLSASDCYRFSLSHPAVDLCMTGPRNGGELDGGLRTLALGPLSAAEMDRARRIGDFVHRRSRLF